VSEGFDTTGVSLSPFLAWGPGIGFRREGRIEDGAFFFCEFEVIAWSWRECFVPFLLLDRGMNEIMARGAFSIRRLSFLPFESGSPSFFLALVLVLVSC
jgi:hypothetical protein